MRILADEDMPAVTELFGDVASHIERVPGRQMSSREVAAADVLLVRSVTEVNAELLQGHSLAFVGSATIGVDHVDQALLRAENIPFAHAPGCNADAVGDYVLAALLAVFQDDPSILASKRVAVVGAGNVGGRLVNRLRALGLAVDVCDPPRAAETPDSDKFCALDAALTADVVCCHTPLTTDGPWPTAGMIGLELLDRLPEGAVFLNAGRGGVVAATTLTDFTARRPDVRLVLDVWDPEPAIPRGLLPRVTLATGHIAGHSVEGKVRGTWMLRQALADHLSCPPSAFTVQDLLPVAPALTLAPESDHASAWKTLARAVRQVYNIQADDDRFRQAMAQDPHDQAFDQYRKNYPQRRELMSTRVDVRPGSMARETGCLLQGAGFIGYG